MVYEGFCKIDRWLSENPDFFEESIGPPCLRIGKLRVVLDKNMSLKLSGFMARISRLQRFILLALLGEWGALPRKEFNQLVYSEGFGRKRKHVTPEMMSSLSRSYRLLKEHGYIIRSPQRNKEGGGGVRGRRWQLTKEGVELAALERQKKKSQGN
jgi:hypothetical protein